MVKAQKMWAYCCLFFQFFLKKMIPVNISIRSYQETIILLNHHMNQFIRICSLENNLFFSNWRKQNPPGQCIWYILKRVLCYRWDPDEHHCSDCYTILISMESLGRRDRIMDIIFVQKNSRDEKRGQENNVWWYQ